MVLDDLVGKRIKSVERQGDTTLRVTFTDRTVVELEAIYDEDSRDTALRVSHVIRKRVEVPTWTEEYSVIE